MKWFLSLFMLLVSTISYGNSNTTGYWAVKCGGFGGNVQIDASGNAKINVNDNNLFISARLVSDKSGKSVVYYQDVIESENDVIDWNSVSKDKPLANIHFINNAMELSWNGFYDLKARKYIWKSEPDFVVASKSNSVVMQKCNFK